VHQEPGFDLYRIPKEQDRKLSDDRYGDLNISLEGTPMTGIIYVHVTGKAKKGSTRALTKIIFDAISK
jgi:hypothetical protein